MYTRFKDTYVVDFANCECTAGRETVTETARKTSRETQYTYTLHTHTPSTNQAFELRSDPRICSPIALWTSKIRLRLHPFCVLDPLHVVLFCAFWTHLLIAVGCSAQARSCVYVRCAADPAVCGRRLTVYAVSGLFTAVSEHCIRALFTVSAITFTKSLDDRSNCWEYDRFTLQSRAQRCRWGLGAVSGRKS
jgi:hypothetical protein